MKYIMSLVIISLSVFLLFGCASISRKELSLEELQKEVVKARETEHTNTEKMIKTLARRAVKRGDGRLDVLLLSGGGQNGAFGVGFLKSWQKNTKNPMPKFDLVAGVSTGALQAPFAFIGTTETITQVDDIYLNAGKKFGPSFDWFFWLKRTGGLINTESFSRLIENTFTEDFKRELVKGFAEDRQLAISTSDFDLGIGHTWNLDTELRNPEGLKRVHSILLAASAIPGIFPSQVIDGHVQSDGGVVSNILPLFTLENYRTLSHELRNLNFKKSIEINVWVIMNYWLYPKLESVEVASRTEMSRRGNNFLFVLAQPQALEHLYDLTEAVGGNVSGIKMHMHVTSIPSHYANEPGAKEIFDKDWMAKLEGVGQARAKSEKPWDEIPSAFERPDN